MSRNDKKKKSTNKYRRFKISPLIPVVAIIEVLVLIAVSTYAWFHVSSNKQTNIGVITVDADSGLDIDFKYAQDDDYINIWNYIDRNFAFEPVSSLDGRNVYVPTSGTFDNTTTSNMVFREGTVNDINSKYINIDFELTNTTDFEMEVYLNNNSYFNVKDKSDPTKNDESRALRLAFYPNNASVGNVGSQMIGGSADYSGREDSSSAATMKTVFYDNTTWNNGHASADWSKVYAYVWNSSTNTPLVNWPGIEMTRSSGPIYSYSFTDSDNVYNRVLFHNGSGSQTNDYILNDGYVYVKGKSTNYTGANYNAKTIYFVKPNDWSNLYVHAWRHNNNTDEFYTNWSSNNASGLDQPTYVGSGMYSYTFSSEVTGLLFTSGTYGGTTQTDNITSLTDGGVYYISGWGTGNNEGNGNKNQVVKYAAHTYPNLVNKTVYFYNTLGWEKPYVVASTSGSAASHNTIELPMTSLTGNVYYCLVPEIYSTVYFKEKEDSSKRTEDISSSTTPILESGRVYRPTGTRTSNLYDLESFVYANYTSTDGYAVISPGVSAGFQRSYTPIVGIDNVSGAASEVIPAFANSIDNYIYGNTAGPVVNNQPTSQTVFKIASKHVLSLSMVIWLEGTDPACEGDVYPGNNIELRLEFSSKYTDTSVSPPVVHEVNTGDTSTYTYKFYDKTREVWTSDRRSSESGVTVAPVMQLYDNTIQRGYLMSPSEFVAVDGKTKVRCWSVQAPQSVALKGHDIIFRRVNPYDENEVWNYWHAGRVAGTDAEPAITEKGDTTEYAVYDVAKEGTDTISFTAFADGSPRFEDLKNNGTQTEATAANVPAKSCGGLWGNHNVRTLTVVDGMSGHPCKNSRTSGTSAVLTVNYTYPYTVSGTTKRSATIEYKASGPNDDIFYYFVMPDVAYTNQLSCTFKNYDCFNSTYAINSDLNTIRYKNNGNCLFAGGTPTGDYFELNREKSTGVGNPHNYWGSDILYVETTSKTSNYMLTGYDKRKLLQAHFYNSSNQSYYSYLYSVDNGNIKGNATTVFVAVVPNNNSYQFVDIETVSWDNVSTIQYMTKPMDTSSNVVNYVLNASNETVSTTVGGATRTLTMKRNHLGNKNIIKLDHMRIRLYVEIANGLSLLSGSSPNIYLYHSTSGATNTWPGTQMAYDTEWSGFQRYYYEYDVNTYDKFQIVKYGDNNTKSQAYNGNLNADCSYNVYRITQGNSWMPTYDRNLNGYTGDGGSGKKYEVVSAERWATANPHYSPRG